MAILVECLIAVVLLAFWFIYYKNKTSLIDKIPGPYSLPLVGNALEIPAGGPGFIRKILEYCSKFYDQRICRIWLGPLPAVLLFRAEHVETLLSNSKQLEKAILYKFLHPWLGTGLLTSTGEKWKSRRKLLTPTFHFRILTDFLHVFNEQSAVMVRQLQEQVDKPVFDVFPYITLCALDIICETAMGKCVNAQLDKESEYVRAVYKMSELIHLRQFRPWLYPDIVYNYTSAGRECKQRIKLLHTFTENVIKERSKTLDERLAGKFDMNHANVEDDHEIMMNRKTRLAFLDMLLYAAKEDPSLDFVGIREEVDTFMFEGHDTTAAGICWAVHLIGAHPEVQERLHEEMDMIFGDSDRPVNMDDIKKMKYLEQVIKEALRLFPSVPLFGRNITDSFEIGGYTLPAGTSVAVITVALHRDPEHFPDPEKFDPDRWLPEKAQCRHPFSYLPFSAGPRNCIGQKFAMNEEKVMLSSILRSFKIESMEKREDLKPMGEIILRPENGMHIKLTQRSK